MLRKLLISYPKRSVPETVVRLNEMAALQALEYNASPSSLSSPYDTSSLNSGGASEYKLAQIRRVIQQSGSSTVARTIAQIIKVLQEEPPPFTALNVESCIGLETSSLSVNENWAESNNGAAGVSQHGDAVARGSDKLLYSVSRSQSGGAIARGGLEVPHSGKCCRSPSLLLGLCKLSVLAPLGYSCHSENFQLSIIVILSAETSLFVHACF